MPTEKANAFADHGKNGQKTWDVLAHTFRDWLIAEQKSAPSDAKRAKSSR